MSESFLPMNMLTSFALCTLLATTMHSTSMEPSLTLDEIIRNCPNSIISHLDGASLTSLTSVSHLLQETCNAVPVKYLSVLFSDAVHHKNTKLIDRFVNQLDTWMFTPQIDELIHQEEHGNNMIRVFKCNLNKGTDNFLNVQSYFRLTQDNKTVRYIIVPKNLTKNDPCIIYLNVNECTTATNTIFLNAVLLINNLSPEQQNILSPSNFLKFTNTTNQPKHGGCTMMDHKQQRPKRTIFSLANSKNMREQLGLITLFLVAARQNNTHVAYTMLNNPKIVDSLSSDILEIVLNDLDCNNEITDVIAAVLFERKEKALNAKK